MDLWKKCPAVLDEEFSLPDVLKAAGS